MKKVLFVCIHNSARSQMAEAFLNQLAGELFLAESAGIEPGQLNSFVVSAMKEIGMDISHKTTNSVDEFIKQNRSYDYLITVCDEASAERCPFYPGIGIRKHFGFEDPSGLDGTDEEKLNQTRAIRDQIKIRIQQFIDEETS